MKKKIQTKIGEVEVNEIDEILEILQEEAIYFLEEVVEELLAFSKFVGKKSPYWRQKNDTNKYRLSKGVKKSHDGFVFRITHDYVGWDWSTATPMIIIDVWEEETRHRVGVLYVEEKNLLKIYPDMKKIY